MSLPSFVVKQPVMVNLLMVVVIIAGLFAIFNMPIERHPSVTIEIAIVSATYPGASPLDVERLITLPLEDRIRTLSDIEQVYAQSYEGRALIFVEYDSDIEDYEIAVTDLKSEIDRIKGELPQEAADSLQVIKIKSSDLRSVLDVTLTGEYGVAGMEQLAEEIKQAMLDIDGIKKVEISGVPTREVRVEADRSRIEAHGVTLNQIYIAIQRANSDLPSGRIDLGTKELIFSPSGQIQSARQIADVVVLSDRQGRSVRVGDLAQVVDGFDEDQVTSRLNGEKTVTIELFMKDDGSVIDLARQARTVIEDFQGRINDVTISVQKDTSEDVSDSIRALSGNALVGLVLVALLMTFLIGARSGALAVIGIPFAFLFAFAALSWIGETINTLSLFGFILVLGMVVDDAIIVIENVYRHLEMGKDRVQAAIDGTHEVMWPVVAAVLTTVAAFLPLLMTEGRIGKFIYVLPVVAMLALAGSLVEALVVLPSHLADFGRLPHNHSRRLGDRMFRRLLAIYRRLIGKALRHRYLVVGGTVAATLLVTMAAATLLRVELFPREDSSSEELIVRLPVGTRLDVTDGVLADLSKRIIDELPQTDVESVTVLAGMVIQHRSRMTTTDGGMITVNFTENSDRRTNQQIKADIRKIVDGIPEIRSVQFQAGRHGPPVDSAVDIRIKGSDLEKMQTIATMIEQDLNAIPGVSDVRTDFQTGKSKLRFIPDRVKLSAYGISIAELSSELRMSIEGFEATSFRDKSDDEVKVWVMYREDDRAGLEQLRKLRIGSSLGVSVPLSELGTFATEQTLEAVNRYDGRRVISVTANVDNQQATSEEANGTIRELYANVPSRFPGNSLEFSGEAKQQSDVFGDLYYEFLIALILIYMILGSQFKSFAQPLVVMITVPFSILGVSIGLIVMGMKFSMVAGMSVIALAGVVVNDSLVLVDFANVRKRAGMAINEAVADAGAQRMRPILMTTFTTIAGLMPMACGLGGEGLMWKPMAICMIWGLAFATLLTLFVIPCAYSLLEHWRLRLLGLIGRSDAQ
ncbi:MAG: efflux RND transporter permease subunit [Candidatus Alcyoniella australis]|nr:efflux RND transporter permease subunit [Candidatus Alcyoniella australis]